MRTAALLVLLAAGCGASDESAEDPNEAAWKATLMLGKTFMGDTRTPGMSLAVVVGGKVAYAEGLGVRRWKGVEPVTTDTRFRWSSVTKMHTSAAAMRLVEDGRLDLDAPITDVIPELELAEGFDPTAITMRQLLTSTSGLPTSLILSEGLCARRLRDVWRDWHPPLWSPPGELFVYNDNAAYSLAGRVLERAAGKPFADLVEETVFSPSGMTTATFDPREVAAADHADGTYLDGTMPAVSAAEDQVPCAPLDPPVGMLATASDVAKTIEMHLAGGGSLLEPASEAAMRDQIDTRRAPDGSVRYGLGMYQRVHHGTRVLDAWAFGHDTRGQVVMAPELGWGIAVAANQSWADPGEVAWKALDLFFPDLPDDDPDFATDPSTWTRYVGTYEDPYVLGRVSVELRSDRLFAMVPELGREWELTQRSGDLFEYVAPDDWIIDVQFIVPDACSIAKWLATSTAPRTNKWPSKSPLGVARRTGGGCAEGDEGALP